MVGLLVRLVVRAWLVKATRKSGMKATSKPGRKTSVKAITKVLTKASIRLPGYFEGS